ncbi:hypothetical protein [Dietzia sp. 179-F 9C3 NHS]|uniref:hypothetical protein n=1 Tax=Dietzia sp. 179-F 9C3 NHS TaxID=3374295 RepID=UPI00387A1FC5
MTARDRDPAGGAADDLACDTAASWAEAIDLFRAAHRGDQLAGRMILDTTGDLRQLTEMLLQLVEVHLLDADDDALARFVTAAARCGPPPRYGSRPFAGHRPRRVP